jgi:excisionase family DNA binding protein
MATNETFTRYEVAEYLKLSPQQVWLMTKRGDIPYFRIGRLLRYRRSDIDKMRTPIKPPKPVA